MAEISNYGVAHDFAYCDHHQMMQIAVVNEMHTCA